MLVRTSFTLPEEDVRLLDRLAGVEGKNRSETLRMLLDQIRPMLEQLVSTFEAAHASRAALLEEIAAASVEDLEVLAAEVERLDRQVVGALSRIEGALTAREAANPRRSNHGGYTPTPPPEGSTE